MDWSPKVKHEFVQTKTGQIVVVRDDLLEGGTKQRALIPFLQIEKDRGVEEFVYASPFSGYAQVALALSCHALGLKCSIFAERDRTARTLAPSDFTKRIQNIAEVHLSADLESAEQRSVDYAAGCWQRLKIPLGLNNPHYKRILRNKLLHQWEMLCDDLGYIPKRLWLPVGSGTLADTFHSIVRGTELVCVSVGVLNESDDRLARIREYGSRYFRVPERFEESCQVAAPIPSNRFYDAKLWRYVLEEGKPGDVWWNVAR